LIADEQIGTEKSQDIHQPIPTDPNGAHFENDRIDIDLHPRLLTLILQFYLSLKKDSRYFNESIKTIKSTVKLPAQGDASRKGNLILIVPLHPAYKAGLAGHLPAS
jgi:hypothetical protein